MIFKLRKKDTGMSQRMEIWCNPPLKFFPNSNKKKKKGKKKIP